MMEPIITIFTRTGASVSQVLYRQSTGMEAYCNAYLRLPINYPTIEIPFMLRTSCFSRHSEITYMRPTLLLKKKKCLIFDLGSVSGSIRSEAKTARQFLDAVRYYPERVVKHIGKDNQVYFISRDIIMTGDYKLLFLRTKNINTLFEESMRGPHMEQIRYDTSVLQKDTLMKKFMMKELMQKYVKENIPVKFQNLDNFIIVPPAYEPLDKYDVKRNYIVREYLQKYLRDGKLPYEAARYMDEDFIQSYPGITSDRQEVDDYQDIVPTV